MKLLIACDDTTNFPPIVDDLRRAGLDPRAAAIVLSVADLLPVPPAPAGATGPAAVQRARARNAAALEQARATADNAAAQLRAAFPGWTVEAEAAADAPAWAIVKKADEWAPDLVVVGAADRSAIGRVLLGSVSQTVLLHAGRSVRIARPSAAPVDAPPRLLVGIDGSAGAAAAVAQVAARRWPAGCQVRLVCGLDATLSSVFAGNGAASEREQAAALLAPAAATLRAAGLAVATAVIDGPPKQVLIDEAERWDAQCVFLGARGLRAVERLLLGSVSTSVAARAPCSVEIVRP